MGAGASTSSSFNVSVEEHIHNALKTGKTLKQVGAHINQRLLPNNSAPPQDVIDWFLTPKPPRLFTPSIAPATLEWMKIARRVATISPQVKNWLVQFTEASLLPPPTNVQQLIKEEVIVDKLLATTADAVIWLKKALVDAYLSKNIKETVCLLLSTDAFWVGMFEDTPHFQRESLFQSLQLFCQEELNNIGKGVKYYYNSHNLSDVLGTFTLPVHPELNCEEVHLRQDHPLIGLTPINSAIHDNDRNTTIYERDESVYIHQLRIIAMCLNKNYQDRVRYIVEEYEGEHIGCSIKGDVRIRNKWRAKEDHGKEIRPRPSCNIDVNRCCATFTEPEQLKKAAIALVEHFGGYAARVKNGFELSVEAASKSFHYRSYMINLIVDFGFTYGQMFHKSNKYNGVLEKYLASPPSNPNEVCVEVDEKRVKHKRFLWNKWRHEAILQLPRQDVNLARGAVVAQAEVEPGTS